MNAVLDIESSNRFFNPFKYIEKTTVGGKDFTIKYTKRAHKALYARDTQLIIEMQIYFSCVVQKRVLFHDVYDAEKIQVNDRMSIAIRSVESESCDPEYYAKNHPAKRVLDSTGAKKMSSARELIFDYKNDTWIGSFAIV